MRTIELNINFDRRGFEGCVTGVLDHQTADRLLDWLAAFPDRDRLLLDLTRVELCARQGSAAYAKLRSQLPRWANVMVEGEECCR
ncbi:MAG: hypothetical protein AB7S38_19155 [Vulcanimicrobiota bacterium]